MCCSQRWSWLTPLQQSCHALEAGSVSVTGSGGQEGGRLWDSTVMQLGWGCRQCPRAWLLLQSWRFPPEAAAQGLAVLCRQPPLLVSHSCDNQRSSESPSSPPMCPLAVACSTPPAHLGLRPAWRRKGPVFGTWLRDCTSSCYSGFGVFWFPPVALAVALHFSCLLILFSSLMLRCRNREPPWESGRGRE